MSSFSVSARVFLTTALILASCEPQPPEGTGGVQVEESFGANGQSCGRGIAVAMIDPQSYASVNVGLLGLDGATLSGSFISSASAPSTLNAALSGDVVFPSGRMKDEIVLIDRLVVSVLSFVEVTTAEVRDQISVRTGFDSNPQDYVELDDGTALVSRLELNRNSGREPFDEGDDLLHIDPASGEILGRVDLSDFVSEATGRARPSALVRTDRHVFVSLTRHSGDFSEVGGAGVAVLAADSGDPVGSFEVPDLKNCGGMSLSPNGRRLAMSCGGLISNANGDHPPASGVVIFDLSEQGDGFAVVETARLRADELGYGPFSSAIAFADEGLLLVKTYGALEGDDAGRPDRVVALTDELEEKDVLLSSREKAFTVGSVLCVAPCGICFVADAGRDVIHRFPIAGNEIGAPTEHRVENEIGLPPLLLGWF